MSKEAIEKRFCWMYSTSLLIGGLVLGICLSYSVVKQLLLSELITPEPVSGDDIREALFRHISIGQIENLLRYDAPSSNYVHNKWTQMGLNATFANYSVLMAVQMKDRVNSIEKFDANGELVVSKIASEAWSVYNPQFSAADGQVLNGTPVYVNYGQTQDYEYLTEELNISVVGHIAIVRLGNTSTINLLKVAEDNGAIGLIMFRDIYYEDDEAKQFANNHSQFFRQYGDPLTPSYPSTDNAYRVPTSEADIPKIPALVMSYEDTMFALNGTTGPSFPVLSDLSSREIKIGPGYDDQSYLSIYLNSYLEQRHVSNVIGVIEGCTEPDRYVIVGNASPDRGTAALVMLSEIIVNTMNSEKWCPRRSIIFCKWGPDQDLSLGMTEWIEQNQDILRGQAVTYLNVDIEIRGKYTFMSESVPLLYQTISTVTKNVINPYYNESDPESDQQKKIYDSYKEKREAKYSYDPVVGQNNFYSPFIQLVGVPTIDYYYDCYESKENDVCWSELGEDDALDHDKPKLMKALLEVWAETLRLLSDTPLLPMTFSFDSDYYKALYYEYYYQFSGEEDEELANFNKNNSIEIKELYEKISALHEAFVSFDETFIQTINEQNELKVRHVNDVVMLLERTFLDFRGLPYDSQYKHVLLGPSVHNRNQGLIFPGLHYLRDKCRKEPEESIGKCIEQFKEHMSVVLFHLNSGIVLMHQFNNSKLTTQ